MPPKESIKEKSAAMPAKESIKEAPKAKEKPAEKPDQANDRDESLLYDKGGAVATAPSTAPGRKQTGQTEYTMKPVATEKTSLAATGATGPSSAYSANMSEVATKPSLAATGATSANDEKTYASNYSDEIKPKDSDSQ